MLVPNGLQTYSKLAYFQPMLTLLVNIQIIEVLLSNFFKTQLTLLTIADDARRYTSIRGKAMRKYPHNIGFYM